MITRIAGRGHSFQGAGLYYLHDKAAQTSERVVWAQTRNMPVNDPQAATNWMAYTALSANRLKQEAGVPLTGRKRERGVVYTFSLSWSPEEQPDQERMVLSADEALEVLGLNEHQSLIVAHDDTRHAHVHIICNLIHPEDGRMYDPDWGSKMKLSEWALKHEQEHGKIYCEQRLENQAERQKGQQVHYKEPLHDRKEQIQALYRQSDNGAAFQAALKENGYTLATGNRRSFVVVDAQGKIHSLSRQLDKEQRAGHLDKLADLTSPLPVAQDVASQVSPKATEPQRETAQTQDVQPKPPVQQQPEVSKKNKAKDLSAQQPVSKPEADLAAPERPRDVFDEILQRNEQDNQRMFTEIDRGRERQSNLNRKEQELSAFYGLDAAKQDISRLKEELADAQGLFQGSRRKQISEELSTQQMNYRNARDRYTSELGKFKARQEEEKASFENRQKDNAPSLANAPAEPEKPVTPSKEEKLENMRRAMHEKSKSRDRDKGQDLSY